MFSLLDYFDQRFVAVCRLLKEYLCYLLTYCIQSGHGSARQGFVTNSIAARITPNGAYRQAVVQAAIRHAVKA